MNNEEMLQVLARLSEQQTAILEELKASKKPAKKDFWDRTMAIAPIISAAIIACIGAYFTYTYNLQQLKVQEIQTIEKFLPHLAGDERSKRAAILAIGSLGNAKLAAKVASVFASQGTASALTSIARTTDQSDQQVVREALYRTLDALSEHAKAEKLQQEAQTAAAAKRQAADPENEEICDNLNKLAEMYKEKGDASTADELQRRANALKRPVAVADAPAKEESSKQPTHPAPVEQSELAKQDPKEPKESVSVEKHAPAKPVAEAKPMARPAVEVKPAKEESSEWLTN